MGKDDNQDPRIFAGFSSPHYTQIPDVLFDELMPDLNAGELKVLLYLMRRIFGFKKESDNISLSQICSGITTKEGRQLDRGTGLSKSTVTAALLSLRKRGIIIRTRNSSVSQGNLPTTYRLRMVGDPLDTEETPPLQANPPLTGFSDNPSTNFEPGEYVQSDVVDRQVGQGMSTSTDKLGHSVNQGMSDQQDIQETVNNKQSNQETDRNFDNSNGTPAKFNYSEIREELLPFTEDFAREFKDEASLRSSLSQMVNIFLQSETEMDDFVNLLYDARLRTKEYSGSVTKESSRGAYGGKNMMPYFFKVLRNLVEEARHQDSRAS